MRQEPGMGNMEFPDPAPTNPGTGVGKATGDTPISPNINDGLNIDNSVNLPASISGGKRNDLPEVSDIFNFSVLFKPKIKLIEVDYTNWITAKVIDYPPTPPIVIFWPIKDCSTRFNIQLSPSSGEIRQKPIALYQWESLFFTEIIKQQGNKDGLVTFRYEGEIASYQMYRIENAPISWESFVRDPTKKITTYFKYENFLFQEEVKPNTDYFYTFRAFDQHMKFSNPSPIYKVRIYENDGVEYLDISVYNFPEPKIITTKYFKRFIRVDTALEQQTYQEASDTGLNGKLGLYNESVYDRKFVLRIRSKHTGKILDIVMRFNKKDKIIATT